MEEKDKPELARDEKIASLERELAKAKEHLEWHENHMKMCDKSDKTFEGIVSGVTNYARMLEKFTDKSEIIKPERIYSMLKHVVESFTYCAGHNGWSGMHHNEGVKAIVDQLNKLKGDLIFSEWYEIKYEKCEKPKVEKKY